MVERPSYSFSPYKNQDIDKNLGRQIGGVLLDME
jgi:hypothetical protein